MTNQMTFDEVYTETLFLYRMQLIDIDTIDKMIEVTQDLFGKAHEYTLWDESNFLWNMASS